MAEIGGLLVSIFILFLVVFTLYMSVKIVPQGEEWIIERLGRYSVRLQPGMNLLIPYIDMVAYKIVTKDIPMDIARQEAITKDNAMISINAIAFVKVIDPVKAVYGVTNYDVAVRNIITTSLRSIVGEMELDQALGSREKIKGELVRRISNDVGEWGLHVKSVEIQDIQPSASMQKAMEGQAAAERERKAEVTRAEGQKTATRLRAEGILDASRSEAEAKVNLAEASAKSIQLINETLSDNPAAVSFILGEKYIAAMDSMAKSENAKVVMIPSDIQQAISGIFGKR